MSVLLDIAALVVAIVALAWASEKFVHYAASASSAAGLSHVFTGVVVVGFGTGLPEFFTAVIASLSNKAQIGVASAIGSTALNVTLVAGIAGVFAVPLVATRTLRKEGAVAILGGLFVLGSVLLGGSRYLGLIGIALFATGTYYTLRGAPTGEPELDVEIDEAGPVSIWRAVIYAALGLLGTLGAAELFLHYALRLAASAHLSGGVTGGILVSFGTSLPEIATAVQAARKGLGSMVLGNVIGSSFFNCLMVASTGMVLATSINVHPLIGSAAVTAAAICVLWLMMRSKRKLERWEGVILLVLYGGYVLLLSAGG